MSVIYFKLLSVSLLIVLCRSHDHHNHNNYEIKSGQGRKTYGGYNQGQNMNNDNQGFSYYQQNGHIPQYQPPSYYGWNFNQPQPSKTYGGVIQQNYPSGQQQNVPWNGNQNSFSNNPVFPTAPSLFRPNFIPPVYFPNNNFPFPTFPNFNIFPQPYYPSQNNYNPNNYNPNNYNPNVQQPQQRPGNNHEIDTRGNDEFPTNAFFGINEQDSSNGNRQWTKDDEMKWQATTKAPYFENKVPGLDCILPASAVLGAMTALKVSSLLPLKVPVGKHLLSCNATELLQAQINLDGIIYDCDRSAITLSCPKTDENNLIVDECLHETLECDVRVRENNSPRVYCTNGTLISNHPVICRSASLTETKNVLNCFYKKSQDEVSYTTARPVHHLTTPVSVLPLLTTANPILATSIPTSILPPFGGDYDDNVDVRLSVDRKDKDSDNNLMPQLKRVIQTVFPHDLLVMPASQMYLPPQYAMGQLPEDLKNEMSGIFPHKLFALSQDDETEQSIENLEIESTTKSKFNFDLSSRVRNQWDTSFNSRSDNQGSSIKTKSNQNQGQLESRFGYDQNENRNFQDRLIFTN